MSVGERRGATGRRASSGGGLRSRHGKCTASARHGGGTLAWAGGEGSLGGHARLKGTLLSKDHPSDVCRRQGPPLRASSPPPTLRTPKPASTTKNAILRKLPRPPVGLATEPSCGPWARGGQHTTKRLGWAVGERTMAHYERQLPSGGAPAHRRRSQGRVRVGERRATGRGQRYLLHRLVSSLRHGDL